MRTTLLDPIEGRSSGIERVFARLEEAMKRRSRLLAAVLAAGLVAALGCASSSKKSDPALGTRTLNCLVVQHEHDSGGSGGSGLRGASGGYYIVFETHEGQATSTYRLEVSRQQFIRFQDGDRVQLTLNNNILVNIQPNND